MHHLQHSIQAAYGQVSWVVHIRRPDLLQVVQAAWVGHWLWGGGAINISCQVTYRVLGGSL